MMKHEEYMRMALEEAHAAAASGDVPVGAVIVYEGKIIAHAHNEREVSGDPTAHAEILAIRRAARAIGRRRLTGCRMYVTLEPCPMCAGAICMSGLDELYYGAGDERAGCAGSVYALTEDAALGVCIPAHAGLMEEECGDVLRSFFQDKR